MSNMGDTFTGTIVAASKTAGRHKGKTISGASIVAVMSVLGFMGINPLDFIVENSPAFKTQQAEISQLQNENRISLEGMEHNDHLFESQNFILQRMFDSGMISFSEVMGMTHAVSNRRHSL